MSARLATRPRDLDSLFWVNVAAIALFFTLAGSRFILGPGVAVQTGATEPDLVLPEVAGSAQLGTASVVVSYRRDNMILFEGEIRNLQELPAAMKAYVAAHPGAVLLVRVDRQVSAQGLLALVDTARRAGFAQVLLAAEPRAEESAGWKVAEP